ncbi:MAG TPA: gliding motility protein GldN [Bacteroidales bacterium]|nr:gliding motility protein GldN [Bacteroidales bacterium]
MKRTALLLVALFILPGTWMAVSAQQITTTPATSNPQMAVDSQEIINVYKRIHIPEKKPIPYVPIREADVMWSKDVWRVIDLRQKMNLPLFYPKSPLGQRMNLFSLIMHGIHENNLHAYKDDKYKLFSTETQIGEKEIVEKLGADTMFAGTPNEKIILRSDRVLQILVKEKWFFDKQHSTMRVRIVGMAPIMVYHQQLKDANGNITISPEVQRSILFWIYFPEYRDLFARYEVFNQNNDSQNLSFDDLFMQRRFASFIFGESNVHDNRYLNDYLTGDDILYEADKIKQKIFEFEHDLWEY